MFKHMRVYMCTHPPHVYRPDMGSQCMENNSQKMMAIWEIVHWIKCLLYKCEG